jgi:hypothetical protein
VTLAELAGFFADPQAQEDMRRRALSMAQSGARGFTTGLLGGPVDLANMAMGGAGGERPVMGSEWVGDKLSGMGLLSGKPEGAGQTLAELGGGLLNPGGAVKGAALATMAAVPKSMKLYRGTNGSTEKISTGSPEWDKHLFAATSPEQAKMYGSSVQEMTVKDSAKVLRESSKDFRSLVGPLKKGENLVDYGTRATAAAKEAGYDVLNFDKWKDLGVAVLNRGAVE